MVLQGESRRFDADEDHPPSQGSVESLYLKNLKNACNNKITRNHEFCPSLCHLFKLEL